MFLQTLSGAHETSPLFKTVKVGAFAILPDKSKVTQLTVDGEEVAFEPLLLEVHRGLISVDTSCRLNSHCCMLLQGSVRARAIAWDSKCMRHVRSFRSLHNSIAELSQCLTRFVCVL